MSITAKALALWAEITGVDPEKVQHRRSGWHEINIAGSYAELQEALTIDPSEVTALLLLDHHLRELLRGQTATVMELAADPAAFMAKLEKPRELLALLAQPEIAEARAAFVAGVREAVARYGASDVPGMEELLADSEGMAILRRDALRSIERLRVDQFLDGGPEPEGRTPVYTKTVHQWWNLNSLLSAATRMPAGVSLNLIRDPDAYQSFFAFTIRNGGNLFTLTDIEPVSHPLQGAMSRRPDRTLDKRSRRNWFPYSLLGVAYDEESGELYLKATEVRALVAYQNDLLPLKPIAELEPQEIVWIAMMFDLIVDRFWRKGWKAPALSYTAEMVKVESALIGRAADAGLPVTQYQPLIAPALTIAAVAEATDKEIGKRYHSPNAWMEARYKARVPEEALNLITLPGAKLHLTGPSGSVVVQTPAEAKKESELHFWDRRDLAKTRIAIHSLASTAFGSREQIEADRKFIARCNYADSIEGLANEEFAARKEEVLDWYVTRVKARLDVLLSWAGHAALWVEDGVRETFDGMGAGALQVRIPQDTKLMRHSLIERYELGSDSYGYRFGGGTLLGGFKNGGRDYECARTGAVASWLVIYGPTNPEEIAVLAGCDIEELPDVLHHYLLREPYTGNCILDRIDPMVWRAKNPWLGLDLRVRVPLSKRAISAIDKAPLVVPDLIGVRGERFDMAAYRAAQAKAKEKD